MVYRSLSILSQLGEVIPIDVTEDIYTNEVAQVKVVLHGKLREGLLSLPMMSKTEKLVSVSVDGIACHTSPIILLMRTLFCLTLL